MWYNLMEGGIIVNRDLTPLEILVAIMVIATIVYILTN